MPTIRHTDEPRLDLSEDEEFTELLQRRAELSEIEKAGREAYSERVELDAEIINRLGNHKSAIAADDTIVSVTTQSRKEYTVAARVITFIKLHKDAVRKWRRKPDLRSM